MSLLAAPAAAQDRTPDEITDQLRRAEQRRDDLDQAFEQKVTDITAAREQLVSLRRQLADARSRLTRAEGLVALGEQALGEAEQRLEVARDNLAAAEQLLRSAEAALRREQAALADQAASAYKYGSINSSELWLRLVRESADPNDLARNLYRLRSVVDYQDEVVQRVLALTAERERLRERATVSRDVAAQREQDAEAALAALAEQRVAAQQITQQVVTAERRQRDVLASLETDAATIEGLMAEVDERFVALQAELERQTRSQRQERIASGFTTYCPVHGAKVGVDFIDDWGFPRSGGRTHEGLDIFAARGTPIVAMFKGTVKEVRAVDSGLGGRVVSYWVAPGEYWYHAHLDTVAPGLAVGDPVEPGQVIGTVGNTGNARTTPPHLHIGNYAGGVARPPYPLASVACA